MKGISTMAQSGTEGLQVLVAQHFERLNHILTDTIRRLSELQACIPEGVLKGHIDYSQFNNRECPACLKVHNPPFRFACDTTDSTVDARVHDSGGRSPNVDEPPVLFEQGPKGITVHRGHMEGGACTANCETGGNLYQVAKASELFHERVPSEILQRVPPVEFLPVLHDDVLCIGTPGKLCTCPCSDCIGNCVRQATMHDEIICCTSDAPCVVHAPHDTVACQQEHKNCKCPCWRCIGNCTRRIMPEPTEYFKSRGG